MGTAFAKQLGFDDRDFKQLMYIDENYKAELDEFNQGKAENASHILVSDDFPLEKFYSPIRKFEVILHRGTDHSDRVEPFLKRYRELLIDTTEQKEEHGSEYYIIAQKIIDNNQII